MKRSEKQLLIVFAVMTALVLAIRIVPLAVDYYHQGRSDIAKLQERMDRYRTLIVDTAQWQQKEQLKNAEVKDLQNWVFPGSDPNLVSSSVQRSLRQLLAENNVDVQETGIPRYSYVGKTDKWLMVEQDIRFSLNQPAILPFLRAIDAARPRLQITAFRIDRNRRNFAGNVTVVGFAKMADKDSAAKTTAPGASMQTRGAASGNVTLTPPGLQAVKP